MASKKPKQKKYSAEEDLKNQGNTNLVIALIVIIAGYFIVIKPLVGSGWLGIGVAVFGFFVVLGLAGRMTESQVARRKVIHEKK